MEPFKKQRLSTIDFKELTKVSLLKKDEFAQIFQNEGEGFIKFHTFKGIYNIEDIIDTHLKEWKCSRMNGGSATMCFYSSCVPAIKLLDQIAKELINDQ